MKNNLVQYLALNDKVSVGIVHTENQLEVLNWDGGIYELAKEAINRRQKIADLVDNLRSGTYLDYADLENNGQILPPILHRDPAHLLVSGTGLTHLGSADTRAAMHAKLTANQDNLTDSMKMFQMGLNGGKPANGAVGVQPEWFYKGDGSTVVSPGGDVVSPDFALDFGDEAEIVGIYLIGDDGRPYRLGFVLGNEYSDHKTEKINYLYLAHSKLRPCSIGPELVLGQLPNSVTGTSKIIRDGEVVWEKPFTSGEANMTHTIANLEYHHFKYSAFLRPGDVHIHFFGTNTLSFSDNFETLEGDVFEVHSPTFGKALRNTLRKAPPQSQIKTTVTEL